MANVVLPPDVVAKWSAPTAPATGDPPYDCGPLVSPSPGQEQAALAMNGPKLDARSGVCLLIAVYAATTKTGAIIHLERISDLIPAQEQLTRDVFTRFPQLGESPTVLLFSNPQAIEDCEEQLKQVRTLIRELCPTAILKDHIAGSPSDPHADKKMVKEGFIMSIEIFLDTATGGLRVYDDFTQKRIHIIDLSS